MPGIGLPLGEGGLLSFGGGLGDDFGDEGPGGVFGGGLGDDFGVGGPGGGVWFPVEGPHIIGDRDSVGWELIGAVDPS